MWPKGVWLFYYLEKPMSQKKNTIIYTKLVFLYSFLSTTLSSRGQQTDFAHLFEELQMHCTL